MRKIYVRGYNHYSHKRTRQLLIRLNEAEWNFLFDLMTVLHIHNMSEWIRNQLFHAYQSLSSEQKKQMADVADWRATEDNL